MQKALADLTLVTYQPWVVNGPPLDLPDDTTLNGLGGPRDWGGLDFLLKFNPQPGDPLLGATDLHWIQVTQSWDNMGNRNYTRVDRTRAAIKDGVPWFDDGGWASIGATSWLADMPARAENGPDNPDPLGGPEPVDPFAASVTYETFLAVDNVSDGVNYVTIYGGYSWGFKYNASDTLNCEPSFAPLFGAGGLVICGVWGIKRWQQHRQARAEKCAG